MTFATSSPGFESFLGKAASGCADFNHCVAFVACILLPAVARRWAKAASRSVRSDLRDAGNLLRFLGGSDSPFVLLAAAQRRLLDDACQRQARRRLLLIDSTQHGQQGQLTENTFSRGNTKSRAKKSSRQQQKNHPRSCHCFVFALLLTPCGTRIPYWLAFYTKEYCKIRHWRHQTQADLAARLILDLPLADSVPVTAAGDTAFDAKQIRKACDKRHYQWVVPINPERRLAGAKPRPQVRSLCQQLKARDVRCVSFRLDQGEYAPMARVSPSRSRSSKRQRTYRVHQRTECVHSVGEVTLPFSSQKEPKTSGEVVVRKVLMSNAAGFAAQELLRWYALRWQIEQFFKERKSELGMCQYKLKHFARVRGWVDLCCLSFCYLEWRRGQRREEASKQERPYRQSARAHTPRAQLRQDVEQADILEPPRVAKTARGKKRLTDLLKSGYDDPAASGGRQSRE